MKWGAVALVGVTAAFAAWRWAARTTVDPPLPIPGEAIALQVEVRNGTEIDGLARRVTRLLRHRGIDVVYVGSAARAESTTVLVRRGDSSAAVPVRQALGVGRIAVDLDARLLLDVTVVLGTDAVAIDRDP